MKMINLIEHSVRLSELWEALNAHYDRVTCFYDDPMTEAMYVPIDDFQKDFDKKELALLVQILELDPGCPTARSAIQKFFP
jgi:hypothetical protein